MDRIILTTVFLPLFGALLAGLAGTAVFRRVTQAPSALSGGAAEEGEDARGPRAEGPRWPALACVFSVAASALLAVWVLFAVAGGHVWKPEAGEWFRSGTLAASWTLRTDTLSAVMMAVVTVISAATHVYSLGYMRHDPHQPRFFAYLSLFTFAMLILVTADNLPQLFFGWEGVGLASYLLIGFWHERPAAAAAAMKAFVVNRVGDFGFLIGIFALYGLTGSLDMDVIFAAAPDMAERTFSFAGVEAGALNVVCLLLFLGAMGKSAQLFLHTWLPDAMEGPTPVSALIHAATMVTAGVFLLARFSPLFELAETAQGVVVTIGALTALFAATAALAQNDVKRVIAYSTSSQLGYMFVAMGVGAYGAGMFHLFTHAFFKALLFLGAGSVIHAMNGEQDMRRMGGLFPYLKRTWALMLAGVLALTGFPLTSGYFSKEAVMTAAFVSSSPAGRAAFWLLVVTAGLTAFYAWRMFFLTFHGHSRASRETLAGVRDSPPVMLWPLYLLAAGALFAGGLLAGRFVGADEALFWAASIYRGEDNGIVHLMHAAPAWARYAASVSMAAGVALAWLFHIRQAEHRREPALRSVLLFLRNGWYFDALYERLFVRPALRLGRFLWKRGDGALIDGYGPDGVASRTLGLSALASRLQTGRLNHYAFVMLLGLTALLTYLLVAGG